MSENTASAKPKDAASTETATVRCITVGEFRTAPPPLTHSAELARALRSIRYCKAEFFPDCVLGTMFIPKKSLPHAGQSCFAFYLTKDLLLLIEDSGRLKQWLGKHSDILQAAHPCEVLLRLAESLIEDDLFYLIHLEKDLEMMEEQLQRDIPRDFFLTLTRYRQKLSELNAYYEQLADIGDRMPLCPPPLLQGEAQAWSNYSRRTGLLQNHVQLLRENVVQLRELYHAQLDAKQNQVMVILTVVTTLFLPLTLLTGWYGMNFAYMPELQWKYGYLIVIALSLFIILLEIWYFKRKKFF